MWVEVMRATLTHSMERRPTSSVERSSFPRLIPLISPWRVSPFDITTTSSFSRARAGQAARAIARAMRRRSGTPPDSSGTASRRGPPAGPTRAVSPAPTRERRFDLGPRRPEGIPVRMAMKAVAVLGVALAVGARGDAGADVQKLVDAAHGAYRTLDEGKNADYIPALAKVDARYFGIAVVSVDGKS